MEGVRRPLLPSNPYFEIILVFLIGVSATALAIWGIDRSELGPGTKWSFVNLINFSFAFVVFRLIVIRKKWYLLIIAVPLFAIILLAVWTGSGLAYIGI